MKLLFRGLLAVLALLAPATALAQGKPVIAIYQMDDLARTGQAPVLTAMIETAISSTSKFRVIERERLGKLVGEQQRAKAGLVTSNTPGKIGGFEGADFLIYGTITTLSAASRADAGATFVAGMLNNGRPTPACGNAYVTLGIDIKITDARTGEVRAVNRIDETQRSATVCGGAGQIDTAVLFRGAADNIARRLVTTIFPIQIAAIQADGTIVLNYGEGSLEVDHVLGLYSKGEEIIDPATGEKLANDEVKLGYVRVISVNGRVSRAVPMTMLSERPAIGSILRPATAAEVQALARQASKRR